MDAAAPPINRRVDRGSKRTPSIFHCEWPVRMRPNSLSFASVAITLSVTMFSVFIVIDVHAQRTSGSVSPQWQCSHATRVLEHPRGTAVAIITICHRRQAYYYKCKHNPLRHSPSRSVVVPATQHNMRSACHVRVSSQPALWQYVTQGGQRNKHDQHSTVYKRHVSLSCELWVTSLSPSALSPFPTPAKITSQYVGKT